MLQVELGQMLVGQLSNSDYLTPSVVDAQADAVILAS